MLRRVALLFFLAGVCSFANNADAQRVRCRRGTVRVTRCIGSGVACVSPARCPPPRCTTACEAHPPGISPAYACSGSDREGYTCSALVPQARPVNPF